MTRAALFALALLALASCETNKGAGRDVSKAGEVIEDAARSVQRAF